MSSGRRRVKHREKICFELREGKVQKSHDAFAFFSFYEFWRVCLNSTTVCSKILDDKEGHGWFASVGGSGPALELQF
jgi:hypothetical protein